MQTHTSFSVYNASAGSGKTFTLVKAYLAKVLASPRPDAFKAILSITFTNKAVAEMKERILQSLMDFASERILSEPTPMFTNVAALSGLPEKTLHQRAKKAVQYVLHNYGVFDVETIDRFNHRLLRTFARDLHISANFDVELDVDLLLEEAVDIVIAKVGKEKWLTDIVLDFSFEKLNEDKSWDITYDLLEISKLLKSENDLFYVEKLKNKSPKDFLDFKKKLTAAFETVKKELLQTASQCLGLIEQEGLEYTFFSRSSYPKFFEKLQQGDLDVPTELGWQKNLETNPLYPKSLDAAFKQKMDGLHPRFVDFYRRAERLLYELQFLATSSKNLYPLALLNTIYQSYKALQETKNVLPISEFNARIFNEIKDQPAPYLYERLGEKYRHYFIDEFQDTSQLQWQNLIPLIDNAISQENASGNIGSLLIVGDAKQSIYRWRGGNPEQFNALCNDTTPFSIREKEVSDLEVNYRSYDQIIAFNNAFFTYLSGHFESEDHRRLYHDGNAQQTNTKKGGFVSIEFVAPENKEEAMEMYPEKVLDLVRKLSGENVPLKDICILTRKREQSIAIAEVLSANDIPVLSSEALLLKNAPQIQFVTHMLHLLVHFEDQTTKAKALYFLHDHLGVEEEKHYFIERFLGYSSATFSEHLKQLGIDFNFAYQQNKPLYELCEYIIQAFSLVDGSVAYAQYFLDIVLEFVTANNATIGQFLKHWELHQNAFSIEVSSAIDAVQLMTVHKAKGLQFRVVVYPFVEDPLFDIHREKIWFPLPEPFNTTFSEMLIPVTKQVKNFGEVGSMYYQEERVKSQLDALNIVYVAMTRAVEQLYVFTNAKKAKQSGNVPNLFRGYLQEAHHWEEEKTLYTFGERRQFRQEHPKDNTCFLTNFAPTTSRLLQLSGASREALLWGTTQEKAIARGNKIHDVLAEITTTDDLEPVLARYMDQGFLDKEESKAIETLLHSLMNHTLLKRYFMPGAKAANEKAILWKQGKELRPDRINYTTSGVVLLDYKTGGKKPSHREQLLQYEEALHDMGLRVEEKFLVYTSPEIEVLHV